MLYFFLPISSLHRRRRQPLLIPPSGHTGFIGGGQNLENIGRLRCLGREAAAARSMMISFYAASAGVRAAGPRDAMMPSIAAS